MIEIREIELEDIEKCLAILRALPQWFGIESAIVEYGGDLKSLDGFTAAEGDRLIGFVGLKRYGIASVEINVIGVHPEHRGKGIGSALLKVVESSLDSNVQLLHLKTLAPTHPDPSYAETRAFWQAKGFIPMDTHELWGGENPCLIMVKPRQQ